MKHRSNISTCAALLCLVLASCSAAFTPDLETPVVFLTSTITPTPYQGLCAYVWTEQQLPELSERLNLALRKVISEQVDAAISAYGETCVDSGTNVVVKFTPEELNYTITARVEDTVDARTLGEWLVQIVLAVGDFHSVQAPASKAGRVEVEFQDGSRAVVASFPLLYAQELVDQGVRGSALFEQLSQ
jgi:hypothetical protein